MRLSPRWFILVACLALHSPPALAQLRADASAPGIPELGGSRLVTLDDAVRLALLQNPGLDEAAARVRRAEASVAEARASQRPRVDGGARFTLQGPNPSFVFTLPPTTPGGAPQRQEVTFGRTFTRSFNVTGSYDPDPYGALRAGRRSAEDLLRSQQRAAAAARNEIVYAVQNLYLAALRAGALVDVARRAVALSEEQLRNARSRVNAGQAAEFDAVRASVDVANERQTLVSAQATYSRSISALAAIMGLESARIDLLPVRVPEDAVEAAGAAAGAALAARSAPASLQQALREAFLNRPEIYQAEWNRRAALERERLARTGRRPSVSLSAGLSYNPDQAGFAVEPLTWSVVANISIPLWDAGRTAAREDQARADAAAATAQREAARLQVADEVRVSLIDLDEANARRRTATANTLLAQEALRLARLRYSNGIAAPVEVIDAETALTQAQTNGINAEYDYLAALAGINRSLGRYGEALIADLPATPRS